MMAFKDLILRIVFAFVLLALATENTVYGVVTNPEGSKFLLLVGKPFDIICNATGRFDRMYWKSPRNVTINKGNVKEQKLAMGTLKLSFTNPTYQDSGEYICRREYTKDPTSFGPSLVVFEKKMEVVFYNPEIRFEKAFENVIVEEGSIVDVNCSATGDSPITYEWRNQYQEIMPNSFNAGIMAASVSQSGDGSILKIRSNETGSYTCTANNSYGIARKEYEILVKSSEGGGKDSTLPFIRHVQIINMTANSIQFGFSASAVASSIRVRCFASYSSFLFEKEWQRGDTYEIKGLASSETYSFRFKAISPDKNEAIDDNLWSKEQVVVMLPDKPDVIFHSLSDGSVKIMWNRVNKNKNVDKYKLTYFSVFPDKEGNWKPSSCPISVDIPSCSEYNYTVSGLKLKTHYELQLQAHTISGYGEPYKQRIYV